MACIIKMSSNEFIDKFIKKFDYKKFNFLLISEDIKTEKKYKNVFAIPSLIPPPNIISEFINNGQSDKYVKKYVEYLQTPRVEAMLTVAVKLAMIDNSNVILLCSETEDEYGYLDIICRYIEQVYHVKVYSYKKYKKDPKKCEEVEDKKKTVKVLKKKLENIDPSATAEVDKKTLKKKLKKMEKKELKIYCEHNSIPYKKSDDKSDIINRILSSF